MGYLKKQTQFLKGQNERKVNYRKELWPIFAIGHLVKTNPIKAKRIQFRDYEAV
jgi:hypothetical protein